MTGRVCRSTLGLLLALSACEPSAPLARRTSEPILTLVLTPDTLVPPDSQITALLATTGTPLLAEYRVAEQFRMTRVRDGAMFDWRLLPTRKGPPELLRGSVPFGGNYGLAEEPRSGLLGRRDLLPGDSYELDVASGGRIIRGAVTIPARPQLVLIATSGTRRVLWPRVPGAELYVLSIETDVLGSVTTRDTQYVLREDREPSGPASPAFVRVTALDPNWARFMSDSSITSAGVTGAYGVFGAVTTASIMIPPRQ